MRERLAMEHIPVSGPWITQKEIDYVTDAVATAAYANRNICDQRFETASVEHVGVPISYLRAERKVLDVEPCYAHLEVMYYSSEFLRRKQE